MANNNKKVKSAPGKKRIKINPDMIKACLENLIDEVNEKTASLRKEVDDIFEQIKRIQGNEYQYIEKFIIDDEESPQFTNDIDKLDYIHDTLIFKYSQLEVKTNTVKVYYKKLLQMEITKLEMESATLIRKLIKGVIRFQEQNIYMLNDMCDEYVNVINKHQSLKTANKYYTDTYNEYNSYYWD
jgi:hypothetical protein